MRRGPGLRLSSPYRFTGVWLEWGQVPGLWVGWHPLVTIWLDAGAPAGHKLGSSRTPWGAYWSVRRNRSRMVDP